MRNFLKFLSQALASFILIVGALVLLGGVLIPQLTGATTYAVLANSMAPRYPIGTLMVTRPSDTIAIGDVITYQLTPEDPTVVTHRVIGVGSTMLGEPRFLTQGDANDAPDPFKVMPEQIHGKLWYAIPYAGFLVIAMDGWREYAKLGAAGLLAIYALWQVGRTIQEKAKAKKQLSSAPAKLEAAIVETTAPTAAAPVLNEYIAPIAVPVEAPVPTFTAPANRQPHQAKWEALENEVEQALAQLSPRSAFQPTMTRAERRRLASQSAPNNPEYSLVS